MTGERREVPESRFHGGFPGFEMGCFLDRLPFGVSLLDTELKILAVNSCAADYFSLPVDKLVGGYCFVFHGKDGMFKPFDPGEPGSVSVAAKALATGEKQVDVIQHGGYVFQETAIPITGPDGDRLVVQIFEDVTDLFEADLQLRRQRRSLNFIAEISRRFNEADTLKEKLEWLLGKLINEFGFDSGGIYLAARDRSRLELICHAGLSEGFIAAVEEHTVEGPVVEKLSEGEVLHFGDYAAASPPDEPTTDAIISEGVGTLVCIPLLFEGQLRGTINLALHEVAPKRDVDLRVMGEIGRGVAMVVANVRLAEDVISTEERFRDIVQHSTACIMGFDRDGNVVLWNKACERIYGWQADEIIGRSILDTVGKGSAVDRSERVIGAIFSGRRVPFTEWRDTAKDGSVRWTMASKFPLYGPGGDVLMGISTIIDITEEKEARRRSAELARIIETGSEAIFTTDLDFRITYANSAAVDLYGFELGELLGRHSWELNLNGLPSKDPGEVSEMIRRGETWLIEGEQGRKDGSTFLGRRRLEAIRDEDGNIIGYVRFVTDITAQRKAEKRVALLAEVAEQIGDAVILTDVNGAIDYVNTAFEELFGYTLAEVRGEMPYFIDADDTGGQRDQIESAVARGMPAEFETRRRRSDGSEFFTRLKVFPIRSEKNDILAWVGIHSDITERKRMEHALRQSEEMYRSLAENLQVGVYLVQGEKLVYANPTLRSLLGYEEDELLSFPSLFDLIRPEDRELVRENMARRLRGDELSPYVVQAVCKGGETRHLLIGSVVIQTDTGPALLGNAVDITDRLLAEQALRESEEMFRLMGESSTDAIALMLGERFVYVNPEVVRSTGYPEQDFLSGRITMFDLIVPEQKELIKNRHRLRLQGEYVASHYEVDVIRVDGGRRTWEVNITAFKMRGETVTMTTGRDVTERKLMQQQMLAAQKAESVQRLAGGIAHDFNNLLVTIMGNVTLLKSDTGDQEPFRKSLERIETAARRAAGLTGQLLAYARGGRRQSVVLDPGRLVEDALPLIRASLSSGVEITTEFPEGIPAIEADRSQLEQVIMNLCLNAGEAMSFQGTLKIRGKVAEDDSGTWVQLHFEDTGPGISPDVMDNIFDPFYSTKGAGRGMGMAAVYGIVQNHGGRVDIINQPGKGACFTLSFPAVEEEPVEQTLQGVAESPGGGETVLVVDDDEDVRDITAALLRRQGYEVLLAARAEEALEMVDKEKNIAVVLLDMVMPGMGGYEACCRIKEKTPGVKVLLSSGFNEPVAEREETMADGFIQKPYTSTELSAKVRNVLDAP